METIYILRGTKIARKDNTLAITTETGQTRRMPIETVRHLVIPGACRLTSDTLAFLGKHGVRVSFLDYYGNFSGSLEPAWPHNTGSVHLAQARIIENPDARLALAKRIIMGASASLLNNLRYYRYRGVTELEGVLHQMEEEIHGISQASDIPTLMGYEGRVRQAYYGGWGYIDSALTLTIRTRRPPQDRVNALVSFGNGLCYAACRHELAKTHLDLTLSVLHAPTQARASLALDLAEIFKPVLVDRMIFRMVRRRMLTDSDFDEHPGATLLSTSGREKVVQEFREVMDMTVIGESRGYRRIILAEAYKLEAHVLGLREYQPFVRRV